MRCSRCVLPDQAPNITFDEDGVCSYCRTYKRHTCQGENELVRILDSCRNPDGDYDCVVGVSGGRDSSYVLLKLVKDYRVRVLAVNYENPFTVPEARDNIERAIRSLDVDIVRFGEKGDRHRKVVNRTARAWFKKPSSALVPIVCIGCKPAWSEIYRIAHRHHIRCIVTGNNPYEVSSIKRELMGISRDEDPRRAFSRYVYSLRGILENSAYFSPVVISALARAYLFGSPYSLGLRLLRRNMIWLQLFDYIQWDEQQIEDRITAELGWEGPRDAICKWRFDCRVKHLVNFMYTETLNMTDKDDFYSNLVRDGLLTRDDALQRLSNENRSFAHDVLLVLAQAGVEERAVLAQFRQEMDDADLLAGEASR